MRPEIGVPAPEFELVSQHGETVGLSGYRGRPALLVFFPLAFSPTCTAELGELRDSTGMFAAAGAEVLAISVDSKATLRAWADQEGFPFRLLADFWPHGAVARRYGALLEDRGYAERRTFLIDSTGRVADTFASQVGEGRPIARYRTALDRLATRS